MAETILKSILQELTENEKRVSQAEMEKFADAILKADRIFVAGAGRSGFVARAFANRLMHMGLTVFFVGEPTTPAIKAGDLLVIGSGSGETGSLVVMAQKAKKIGASVITPYIRKLRSENFPRRGSAFRVQPQRAIWKIR